jgi:hypothetical protein
MIRPIKRAPSFREKTVERAKSVFFDRRTKRAFRVAISTLLATLFVTIPQAKLPYVACYASVWVQIIWPWTGYSAGSHLLTTAMVSSGAFIGCLLSAFVIAAGNSILPLTVAHMA